MEVEHTVPVSNAATRFTGAVQHGNGGGFFERRAEVYGPWVISVIVPVSAIGITQGPAVLGTSIGGVTLWDSSTNWLMSKAWIPIPKAPALQVSGVDAPHPQG
jgi:hypothetical protein